MNSGIHSLFEKYCMHACMYNCVQVLYKAVAQHDGTSFGTAKLGP